MKNLFFFLLLLISACKTPENVVTTHQGDGTSAETAVLIRAGESEQAVEAEEKAWLSEKYPGYTYLSSHTGPIGQKMYAIYRIKTADEMELEVYFDISIFYEAKVRKETGRPRK